jgi:predicted dehydrogenase
VRLGMIGVGGQGRALLRNADPAFGELRAICDINPAQIASADKVIADRKLPPAQHYVEWREMLEKEDLEGILIAVPLWMHADIAVGCLDAGKHVLCEKMMAWDLEGCERMARAAAKSGRLLEIGYQRRYNPVYEAAFEGIVRAGTLGEVYHARMIWHRNANWRRSGTPPSPDYDPSRWGYPSFEHLLNWRLYWKYSKGLFAELASHQVNVSNWFFGGPPEAVFATGGVQRFKDGREVYDHIYAVFDYPGGRTATYSSVESNALENRYEVFFGTKATLMLQNESEAMLFEEGAARQTGIEVTARTEGAVIESSETRPTVGAGAARAVAPAPSGRPSPTRLEISRFCSAVRTGTPLACGPESAIHSAKACIKANDSVGQRARLSV